MRAYLRAGLILSTAFGFAGMALGQSSSPFSGWFGGSSQSESPVALSLRVAGDDSGLERTIRNTSLIAGALAEDRNTGQDVLAAARADYARILGALYDLGHYSALIYITLDGVEAAEIAPLDAPAMVRNVVVTVDPGPLFRFSRAAIAPVAPGTELPPGYRQGEAAGTGTIKAAALAGVEGWRDQGHAKADVGGQQITADHEADRVDSQIALAPGPAVTFGRLNISGNQRLDPRRLRKIAGFPEGQRFDPADLDLLRQRLRRTGVFSAITVTEADQLGPGNTLDVDLTVVEQKPRRLGAGFEISNTDGAQVSAYWMHRNLLRGGERLRIDLKMSDISSDNSGRDEEIKLRIDRPATITPDTTAYVETRVARLRETDYASDSASVALGFNHIFSERLTGDLAIKYEVARVRDANGRTDFKVVALPMDIFWDQRDVPTDAKRGYYLSADLTPFKGFDGTGSGARLLGEGRAYFSAGEDDRFTLAGRLRAGTIEGSDIATTPREYLFYSGGGGTVRGQAYQSLGVTEIVGPEGPIKTGGMSIASASAELRFQVRDNIGLVLFTDYGRVWTEGSFAGDSGWHAGAGAGVRYATPIGPLRFDIAAPVGNGDTDDGIQLYLGLGQAF